MPTSAYDPGWMSTPWSAPGSRIRIPGIFLAMALVAAATVTACAGAAATPSITTVPAVTPPPLGQRETAYDPPRPAPPLQLTDQDGRPFDLTSLRGAPVLVYFGYTHCPDICPATLSDLRDAVRLVAGPVHVVFVTIDPDRDNVAAMKQYVDFYQAGFIGLTGSDVQIAAAAAAWGVSYEKLPSDSANGYAMAHSTDVYLVDPGGVLRNHIFFGAGPQLIAQLLRAVI
jgi:protein SCO1/2